MQPFTIAQTRNCHGPIPPQPPASSNQKEPELPRSMEPPLPKDWRPPIRGEVLGGAAGPITQRYYNATACAIERILIT